MVLISKNNMRETTIWNIAQRDIFSLANKRIRNGGLHWNNICSHKQNIYIIKTLLITLTEEQTASVALCPEHCPPSPYFISKWPQFMLSVLWAHFHSNWPVNRTLNPFIPNQQTHTLYPCTTPLLFYFICSSDACIYFASLHFHLFSPIWSSYL